LRAAFTASTAPMPSSASTMTVSGITFFSASIMRMIIFRFNAESSYNKKSLELALTWNCTNGYAPPQESGPVDRSPHSPRRGIDSPGPSSPSPPWTIEALASPAKNCQSHLLSSSTYVRTSLPRRKRAVKKQNISFTDNAANALFPSQQPRGRDRAVPRLGLSLGRPRQQELPLLSIVPVLVVSSRLQGEEARALPLHRSCPISMLCPMRFTAGGVQAIL
jgi:hypothetical protein